jgi:uncharacterized RDD family membrane protein YckC
MIYAGIVTRAVALAIDALVVNVIAVIVGAAVELIASLFGGDLSLGLGGALAAGAGWILWVTAYFTFFWTVTGQTPGNRVLGIRVVSADGGGLGALQALRRFVALVIAALPLGLGFVPVLFDDRRRGLHDMIGGTVVLWVEAAAPVEPEAPEPAQSAVTRGAATVRGAPPHPGS